MLLTYKIVIDYDSTVIIHANSYGFSSILIIYGCIHKILLSKNKMHAIYSCRQPQHAHIKVNQEQQRDAYFLKLSPSASF